MTVVRSTELTVCLPAHTSKIPASETTKIPSDLLKECTTDAGGAFAEKEDDTRIQPKVHDGNEIIIFVGDGTHPLSDAHVSAVAYSIHGLDKPSPAAQSCQAPAGGFDGSYFVKCWVKADQFANASNDDTLEFETSVTVDVPRFARFVRQFSFAGRAVGFWIPVGLFGTNFKSNTDGITLAALPVGLAWGAQWNFSGTAHLGVSAFGSWTIAPQKTDDKNTGNYTLASLSVGAFFDLNGYVYLGYGYALDFRSDHSNPGHMAVIGLGPNLLQFLKGDSQ